MKKGRKIALKIISLHAVIALCIVFIMSCGEHKTIAKISDLPAHAKGMLDHFFAQDSILSVLKNSDNKQMEVKLSNGNIITFDSDGNWTKINGAEGIFPMTTFQLLPIEIFNYLYEVYPNNPIEYIAIADYGYKVVIGSLPNTVLKFDHMGNMLGVNL